jgi:hypothetical protein
MSPLDRLKPPGAIRIVAQPSVRPSLKAPVTGANHERPSGAALVMLRRKCKERGSPLT